MFDVTVGFVGENEQARARTGLILKELRRWCRFGFLPLHTACVCQSSHGSRRQHDAEGGPPTHAVRLTVSRRRLAATLMGVLASHLRPSTLGYFRTPRHEANECEQQEVCCCTCLQRRRQPSVLYGCGASVMLHLSVSRGFGLGANFTLIPALPSRLCRCSAPLHY